MPESDLDGLTAQELSLICQNHTVMVYMWSSTNVIFFAVGSTASFAIIWLLGSRLWRGATPSPNVVFVLNISIMDFLFFLIIPLGLFNEFLFYDWRLQYIMHSAYSLSMTGRPLMMACICLDCYVAVVHPVTYSQRKSLTPRVISVALVWLVTLVSAVTFTIFSTAYSFTSNDSVLLISTAIIFICDSLIIFRLVKSERGKKGIHSQKRRAIHTVVITLVVAAISYIPPLTITSFQYHIIQDLQVSLCMLHFLTFSSFSLGSAVMPTLWIHFYGKVNKSKLRE